MDLLSELPLRAYRQVFLGNDKPLGYTLEGGEPTRVSIPDGITWYVRHHDDRLTDAYLPTLFGELTARQIPGLSLASCRRLTDGAASSLGGLGALEVLDLFNTPLGDATLEALPRLTMLKSLNLAGTNVTDAGLANLAKLERLERLHLGWTNVGDEGLVHLTKCRSLRVLDLRATKVTNAGMRTLASMPGLDTLGLQETGIGDAGVAALRPLAGTLERLYLGYTAITDAAVDDLRALTNLRTLMLRATRVKRDHDNAIRASLTKLGGPDSGPDGVQEGLIR